MLKHAFTILGAVAGLFLLHGGFWGLLAGAFFGFVIDSNRKANQRQKRVADRGFVEPLFALLGAVSKSDGRVSEREIAVVERLMARLQLDAQWRKRAIAGFDAGKQTGFQPATAIEALRKWSDGYRDLAFTVVDVMVETVLAEGQPTAAKQALLKQVAHALGISDIELMAMMAMKGFAYGQAGRSGPRPGGGYAGARPPPSPSRPDPYAVLGITRNADDAAIKRAYRKLISEHHPDRLGNLPADMRRRAEERARDINAAYDQIKTQRGFK